MNQGLMVQQKLNSCHIQGYSSFLLLIVCMLLLFACAPVCTFYELLNVFFSIYLHAMIYCIPSANTQRSNETIDK